MTIKKLSQAARETYRAAYPGAPTVGSHQFGIWMADHGFGPRDIAVRLACTPASVVGWASGRRVPTIELARRIELLTSIPIASWVEVVPAPTAPSSKAACDHPVDTQRSSQSAP